MYIPKHFKNTNDEEIKNFIREYGFGIVISKGDTLLATHVPLELSADGTKLTTHLSRANAQWKTFQKNEEVLVVFHGPHSYISSSWYNHENVPTWNYIAVHVYGTIRIVEGDELYAALQGLVNRYESASKKPVSVETMSQDYVKKQMNGIVGIEINITRIEAAYKLSQNRDKVNYNAIIHQLEKQERADANAVAEAMKKIEPTIQ